MLVDYPNISKLIGFDCHNYKEPYYTMSSIDFTVKHERLSHNFHIPLGFTSDGCTLKLRIIWLILGCPHTPKYLPASIIHDYFCKHKYLIDRKTATKVFEYMLRAEGVIEWKVKIMSSTMNLYQKYVEGWE